MLIPARRLSNEALFSLEATKTSTLFIWLLLAVEMRPKVQEGGQSPNRWQTKVKISCDAVTNLHGACNLANPAAANKAGPSNGRRARLGKMYPMRHFFPSTRDDPSFS